VNFRRPGASLDELEALYRRRFHEYLCVAAAILRDADAGRDAVQEAFAGAVRARRRFRGRGPLDAWLWRAVVNAALSERRRRVGLAGLDEPSAAIASANGHHPLEDEVRAAIDLLPERQRLVLFLRYYGDLDYREIADALGIAQGTVGAALHAAHNVVRQQLKEVAR
jgi:RNA polymerase sigma-70 factor (ECF subfamily)